ncbi:MAG: MFS transporter [Pseudomonadota bacterium]
MTGPAPRSELAAHWPLIPTACVGIICSAFVLPYYTVGALLVPVTDEFGWSRAQFQAAILFSSGLGAATSPLVGWLNDRYGSRRVALPAMIGVGLGFLLASTMDARLWTLFLAYGAMALLGAGTIPVTWTRSIANTFFQHRGLALGLALAGTGLCAAVMPHYAVFLTDRFGWRAAYVGLALMPLLLALPVLFLFFRPREAGDAQSATSKALETGMTLREASSGYRFWVVLASILFAYMGFSGIGPNLLPSMTDDGYTREQAAGVQSVFGVSIIIGRIVVGFLIDRLWAPGVAAVCLLLPALGTVIFHGEQSLFMAQCASFLIGFAAGAELDLMAFLVARYFGLRHYAKIYAVLYATLAVCSGTAPMLFATVFDFTGSYDLGFLVATGLFVLAAIAVLTLGRYPQAYAHGSEGLTSTLDETESAFTTAVTTTGDTVAPNNDK